MEIVRKLWTSVEANAEKREQAKLKQDIAQSVERLKGRIEKSLRARDHPFRGGFSLMGWQKSSSDLRIVRRDAPASQGSRSPYRESATRTRWNTL